MSLSNHEPDHESEKRFIAEMLGAAKREYPAGRVGPNDEGLSTYAIAYDPTYKIIRIQFTTPMNWIGLELESAVQLYDALGAKLKEMELDLARRQT